MTKYHLYLKLSLRSLIRNKRRSMITIVSIFLGVFVICMMRGMIAAVQNELVQSLTKMQTGDVQIYRKGYLKSLDIAPLNLSFDSKQAISALQNCGLIADYAPRIKFSGMISTGNSNVPFISVAGDPIYETAVCPRFAENIIRGRFISPAPAGNYEIVITENMARSLKIQLNDRVILLSVTTDGSQNTIEAKVVGISASMLRTDKFLVFSNIHGARELLQMDSSEVNEVIASFKPGTRSRRARIEITNSIIQSSADLEVFGWEETMSFFKTAIQIQNVFNLLISIILFVLVASIVVNTILMSVYERTSEIGMLKAIGMKSYDITRLFRTEGLILGLAGGMAGVIASNVIMTIIRLKGGIVYSLPVQFGAAKPWLIFPSISYLFSFLLICFGIVCGISGAFYPARKAASLEPIDAITSRNSFR